MKIFLSAMEGASCTATNGRIPFAEYFTQKHPQLKWNLMSFYSLRGQRKAYGVIKEHSEQVLIDSGAHSFQKGKKVDWERYTNQYAEFIVKEDCSKMLGYFEMDVDNILGYEEVLRLREILESASDKIIPVWHKNRGIDDYKKMCQDYAGKIVAITGFRNEDIQDHQYMMFLKYAKQFGCKVHCLGMTRKPILDTVPFDYTDSASWLLQAVCGHVGSQKVSKEFSKTNREDVYYKSYLKAMKMQDHYYKKWRSVCGD